MQVENYVNDVRLIGEVADSIRYSHKYKGIDYYKFSISIKRPSGNVDAIPIMIDAIALAKSKISVIKGSKIMIKGRYMSYNSYVTGRVVLYVLAELIKEEDNINLKNNEIKIKGYIVKKNPVWITSNGNRILSIIVAIDNLDKIKSYVPCIMWDLEDETIEGIQTGNEISLKGIIHAREYEKKSLSGKTNKYITYEVSVKSFTILN